MLSKEHIVKHAVKMATRWREWIPPYPGCLAPEQEHLVYGRPVKGEIDSRNKCWRCAGQGFYKEFYQATPAARYYRFGLSANTIALFLNEDTRAVVRAMSAAEKQLRPYFCAQVQSVVWSTQFQGEDGPHGRNPITELGLDRPGVLAMAYVQAITIGNQPFAQNRGGVNHCLPADQEIKMISDVLGVEPAPQEMSDENCLFCKPEERPMIKTEGEPGCSATTTS